MNEILLNAILNLFALQAALLATDGRLRAREFLARYLAEHFRLAKPEPYMELYDAALGLHLDSGREELLGQARGVAARLKPILPRLEQHVFLLRSLEMVTAVEHREHNLEPVRVVAEELAVDDEEWADLLVFCQTPFDLDSLSERFLLAGAVQAEAQSRCRFLARPEFKGRVCVLQILGAESSFLVTDCAGLSLDSLPLEPSDRVLLQPGAILRDAVGGRIYEAEIGATFLGRGSRGEDLVFQGESLELRYPGSDVGLHNFSFREYGGRLVGVMGVSGAGKSTLLSILNGQMIPDSGRVTVNGVDLHRESGKLEGVMGYVPQDDLLFEDLTVFENLFYGASLCLANLDRDELTRRVDGLLEELHQPDIRNLKVGSPLEKTISGGQRKRLNIALELIREPSILFVDEPTSGLSSSDSENVMALLKAQAAKGRLVIVVIHQPSSRIYKMFDSLWILDQGGRPIWEGNPLDAIVYFRSAVHKAGMEEYSCPRCGEVNPEQLFEIIEARTVDQGGHYTRERRVSPGQWHELYLSKRGERSEQTSGEEMPAPPQPRLWRPGRLGMFGVFFLRTVKSRLANRQYMLINIVVPLLLAVLTALISRGAWGQDYIFAKNQNIGTYFFISVVVALFLGLSVSAEEINRDQKVLKRERFLHLSWPCYVTAKSVYLVLVAALQMALFVLVGNSILQIPDMLGFTWLVLFSCTVCSSILGLNISASFRSAITIYILIPLILVPQMMLGGVVVPFDELLHHAAGTRATPLIADLMPSRWGYEALVVEQYRENRYMERIFDDYCADVQADYMTDVYIPEVRALADYPLMEEGLANPSESARRLRALKNEIALLERRTGLAAGIPSESFEPARYDSNVKAAVKELLKAATAYFQTQGAKASERVRAENDVLREKLGSEGFEKFKDQYSNKDVSNLALNAMTLEPVRLSGERLVQVAAPACQPVEKTFGAHFLATTKHLGPWILPTQIVDLAVIWLMTALFFLALNFSLLPGLMSLGGKLGKRK